MNDLLISLHRAAQALGTDEQSLRQLIKADGLLLESPHVGIPIPLVSLGTLLRALGRTCFQSGCDDVRGGDSSLGRQP